MEDLIKKVAYLKGYAEGLDISPKSDEGKLIMKLIDVMGEMADTVEALNRRMDDAEDFQDEIDECVLAIADDIYGDDYFGEDDEELDEYDDEDIDEYGDDEFDDGGSSDYFEIECPNCGEDVMIDFDMIDDDSEIVCPNCREEIELEFRIESDEEKDGE